MKKLALAILLAAGCPFNLSAQAPPAGETRTVGIGMPGDIAAMHKQ